MDDWNIWDWLREECMYRKEFLFCFCNVLYWFFVDVISIYGNDVCDDFMFINSDN